MKSHEYDAYLDETADGRQQTAAEPDYHEQLLLMHELEMTREAALKRHGAIDALHRLTITLSALCLREDVKGDYFFGLHTALEVVERNLGVVKGGVL